MDMDLVAKSCQLVWLDHSSRPPICKLNCSTDTALADTRCYSLGIHPFMSYAAAYTLYNYRFSNQAIGDAEYSNLRLIRAFEHGLDPLSSEAGFVLTHVDMVKHSSGLVKGSVDLLSAVATNDQAQVNDAFELLLDTMRVVEASMETMWAHSKPKDYISYRTFIFGITNQSMFPNGVVYEGENDNKPMSFRGESGANDSMIPLLDALLQIPMPANPLTEILKDFRSYRPKPHREFLAAVRAEAETVQVRAYCSRDADAAVSYLKLLDHVRSFRWRHWLFTREYIIRRSSHPTATGGSPIIR
jgi:indoleamine 2,3-dioxygenase